MLKLLHRYKRHCIGLILLILIGSIGSYLYFKDNYTQYDMYEKDNKKIGILQHYTQELPGRYYISLYYPAFKDQELAQVIEKYKESHLQIQPTKKMQYISIDYATDRILDRFIRITFYQTRKNEKNQFLNKEVIHYTYDEQEHRLLSVDDLLQGDYKQSLLDTAQKQTIKDVKVINLENFQLEEEDGIIFYVYADASSSFYYAYATHSQYFKSNLVNI